MTTEAQWQEFLLLVMWHKIDKIPRGFSKVEAKQVYIRKCVSDAKELLP